MNCTTTICYIAVSYRDDPEYTVEKAAEEFELPLVTVQAMADSTRSAVLYKNIKDSHLWIAK